ncbi:MAG: ATP-binding protein [Pseudomonadota bacterium]
MTLKKQSMHHSNALLSHAEEQAAADEAALQETLSPGETRQVLHELRVRQIELEQMNEQLLESNYVNEQIILCAQEGVIVYSPDLRYQYWNSFMEQLTGMRAPEVLGKKPLELFPYLRETDVIERQERALAGETSDFVTFPYHIPATGKSGWVAERIAPLRNTHSEIIGVITTIRDITDHKLNEFIFTSKMHLSKFVISHTLNELLVETLNRIELLTRSTIGFFHFLDKDQQTLTLQNWSSNTRNKMCTAKGKGRHDDMNKAGVWVDCVRERRPVIYNDYASLPHRKVLPPGHALIDRILTVPVMRGGIIFAIMGVGNKPVDYDDQDMSNMVRIADMAWDIIERKQAEEEHLKLEQQLLQAQKMEAIGTLSGGIAHDFNNILTGIIGFAEIAKDKVPQDSQLNFYFDLILKLGDRAVNLVRQILVFSRKTDSKRKVLQLRPLIKEVLSLFRATLPASIEIRRKFLDQGSIIEADSTQIHQVLMNLCTNAFHAMQENGGVLELELTSVSINREDITSYNDIEPGPYVLLKVSDTGTGIDPAIINRIFEPFFTTKEVDKGTGLGLSVVHGIIKAHGGTITVASEPGRGTTFSIFLPEISEPAEIIEAKNNIESLSGSEHVLFVDDEVDLIVLAKELLEPLGYKVTAAQSGQHALALFQKASESFDLVITDLSMPHMTGYDLALKLIKLRPDIPVIICTGYNETMLDNKEKGQEKGQVIKAVLKKPFKRKALAEAVRKALDIQ